ncbi:ROK family protein [Cellulomonas edaphi]|uniref:ROK family protein n=1 Tax=Cellulomonas edaphi TaxID=3053468 RepID=A0ABT7S957_9CELL|nr:ROK family protein [Cellulomons edaphi]MDM7832135.1 ROK family protein [Cellulomons edaphi]
MTRGEPYTLGVDCGGSGIKASVLDADGTLHTSPVRVRTPYPLPPERLVETIAEIAADLPRAHRVTVGVPGMIRHGVVVATPHYVTRAGPRTAVVPALAAAWQGCDIRALIAERLGLPTLVLNDAEVHGAGLVTGQGIELVLTLGTGLGAALFDEGVLAPHLELSHAPVRRGLTYDVYIGQVERRRLGNTLWSRRVQRMVDGLWPVVRWDTLYLGGGNAHNVSPAVRSRLGDRVVIASNKAGITGGVRAWDLGTRPAAGPTA